MIKDIAIRLESFNKKICGFSLAEVLIAMAVIGVIAAISIPSLVASYEESAHRSKLKKVHSVLSQAFQHIQINGYTYWDPENKSASNSNVMREMCLYLNCDKRGTLSIMTPVDFYEDNKKNYGGYTFIATYMRNYQAAAHLNDGTIITSMGGGVIVTADSQGRDCYRVFNVDLNGTKGPNTVGKDLHTFTVQGTNANDLQVLPTGYPGSSRPYCVTTNSYYYNSMGCTYKLLSGDPMP